MASTRLKEKKKKKKMLHKEATHFLGCKGVIFHMKHCTIPDHQDRRSQTQTDMLSEKLELQFKLPSSCEKLQSSCKKHKN